MNVWVDRSGSPEALVIEGANGTGRFKAGTIADLTVSEHSTGKTVGLVGGIAGGFLVGVGIVLAVILSGLGHIH